MEKNKLTPETYRRMQYLSTFLRELRINSGYTQEQVAREISLSRNSISKIERMGFFRIQHLFLLAEFYDMPLSLIFIDMDSFCINEVRNKAVKQK